MSLRSRLFRGESEIDFYGIKRHGFAVSGAVILISLLALFGRGLNLSIDFEGGVVFQFPAATESVGDARDSLAPLGLDDAKIQVINSPDAGRQLRIQTEALDDETVDSVFATLGELTGAERNDFSFTEVGPSWGDEITASAQKALIYFLLLIAAYIAWRFEWRMAAGALVAVVHDVLASVGVYALFQFEVTPGTVIAFLTILGYSLYDTIVVFDKLRENVANLSMSQRNTYSATANRSMNDVLMRSINTTLTSVTPVISMLVVGGWILGAVTLRDFALALFVGLVFGAYSSIFVAAPILVLLKEREQTWVDMRERLERTGDAVLVAPRVATVSTASSTQRVSRKEPRALPQMPTTHATKVPPRPRKKGKKK